MDTVLETIDLTRRFGEVVAADGICVRIESGTWVGIIGPNGAGKTTFLNLITGYVVPERGRILFLGQDITGRPPREVTRLGIARSFQVPQLYNELSVLENLLLALAARSGQGVDFWWPLRRSAWIDVALQLLERFGLRAYASRPARELPEGGRKLLDIALAFALQPRLLLLDEPTSGVSRAEKFAVMDTLLAALQDGDVTVLFVEHDMEVVQRYAQRVLVFHEGRIVADGEPQTLFAEAHW